MARHLWAVPGEYDDTEILRELAAQGMDRIQVAAELTRRTGRQRTPDAVRMKAEDLGIRLAFVEYGGMSAYRRRISRVVSETPERVVYAPEETEAEEWEELYERAVKRTGREVAKHLYAGIARVQIASDKPIAVSLSSDWHVSTSTACDLPGLRRYLEAIRDTPGAFGMFVGDAADNNIKWSKQMHDVPDEWRLVGGLLNIAGLKMLGVTSGNHDDWSRATAGIDALRWLSERERIHFASDELQYIIEIVDPATREMTARYSIFTRHKFRRNSNMNWTHACYRLLEERVGQWPEMEDGGALIPDVIAIGDNHLAAVEERDFANKPVFAARMGPWQVGSSFGRAMGFARCPPTAPTFILHPTRSRRIAGFADYESAFDHLRRVRAEYRNPVAA